MLNRLTLASPVASFAQQWVLDATGNWSDFREGPGGGTLLQVRTANTVNEYTAITGTTTWTTPAYDDAGNTTSFPQPNNLSSAYTATYDAWNRMTAVQASSVNVATFAYDGRNRRITQNTYTSGSLTETREFYFTNSWQDIEEQVSGSMVDQYVYGLRYIDELVCRDDSSPARYYAAQDANFNVTSICDKSSGAVDERYRYQPYGQQTVYDASWTVLSGSAYDWVVGFQGLESDVATGLVYVRNRWLHAELGRWVGRDSLRYFGGINLYECSRSNPNRFTDPLGLMAVCDAIYNCIQLGDFPDCTLNAITITNAEVNDRDKALDECNKRLRTLAIALAATAALQSLGLAGITPTPKNDLKAGLTLKQANPPIV
jgi:RHS repeat-associated protein